MGTLDTAPVPSSPNELPPQHRKPPSASTTQESAEPAAMATGAGADTDGLGEGVVDGVTEGEGEGDGRSGLSGRVTRTGVVATPGQPLPRAPHSLLPQHTTPLPAAYTTHVWYQPHAMLSTEAAAVAAGAGTAELFANPLPSCPKLLSPQHNTDIPDETRAHVCPQPADTTVAPVTTSVDGGSITFAPAYPTPVCPMLFQPQHRTLELTVSMTHVCQLPATTMVTPEMVSVSGGNAVTVTFGRPSWPCPLLPQHRTLKVADKSTHVCDVPAVTAMTPVMTSALGT